VYENTLPFLYKNYEVKAAENKMGRCLRPPRPPPESMSFDRDKQAPLYKYTIILTTNARFLPFLCKKNIIFPEKRRNLMNYNDYEKHFSKPRLTKYKQSCRGNEQKALELYMLNIEMSKNFYGILNLFEVALRNAINEHYKNHFEDDDWILNQANGDFFEEYYKDSIAKQKKKLNRTNSCSHDKLVAALTFGFWTDMFFKPHFTKGNKTLLKIFPNKEKGINCKFIYKELDEIRDFRNRIAHHEAICFNRSGEISDGYMLKIWEIILKYTHFLTRTTTL